MNARLGSGDAPQADRLVAGTRVAPQPDRLVAGSRVAPQADRLVAGSGDGLVERDTVRS